MPINRLGEPLPDPHDPAPIRGHLFSVNCDAESAASSAARILKEAVERKLSYVVISIETPEELNKNEYTGDTAFRLGDIQVGLTGSDSGYQMLLMIAMAVQWAEITLKLPREAVIRGVMGACRGLDKLRG